MEHGEVTRLAEVVPLERVEVMTAQQAHPVIMEPVMAAGAAVEYQAAPTQAAPEEMAVFQAVVVQVEADRELLALHQGQAATEPEARCEYGPGSSEQRRTQRPGWPEA